MLSKLTDLISIYVIDITEDTKEPDILQVRCFVKNRPTYLTRGKFGGCKNKKVDLASCGLISTENVIPEYFRKENVWYRY